MARAITRWYRDPHLDGVRLFVHYGDLTDSSNLSRIYAKDYVLMMWMMLQQEEADHLFPES